MLRLNRIATTAVLAVCLAVLTTSAAWPADPLPTAASSAAHGAATPPPVDLRSPDARDAGRTIDTTPPVDLRSPDARDAGRTIVPAPVQVIERPVSDRFQWSDAGIGAAGMLALVLLVASLVMLTGQRRSIGRATAAGH